MPACSLVASGGYINQPLFGAAPKKIEPQTKTPPIRKHQKHGGQEEDRHRLEDRHGEQEHHHRAVQGEDLIVHLRRQEVILRHGELSPDQQAQQTREQHEAKGGGAVPQADLCVVDGCPVAPAARIGPYGAKLGLLRGLFGSGLRRVAHCSPFSHAAMAPSSSAGR
jgi:hypothetical protein